MYREDLSVGHDKFGNEITYVGWIDLSHKFSTGKVDDFFVGMLWEICHFKFEMMRGFHVCEFCNMAEDKTPSITFENETLNFGYCEIRVFDKQGKIYAAPDLIFHYVVEHNYLPPSQFIDAVCNGISPFSYDYYHAVSKMATKMI